MTGPYRVGEAVYRIERVPQSNKFYVVGPSGPSDGLGGDKARILYGQLTAAYEAGSQAQAARVKALEEALREVIDARTLLTEHTGGKRVSASIDRAEALLTKE